jgi:hypothetical protein
MKVCFFTVASDEYHTHRANTLGYTFKKHTPYTLKVFTQNPEILSFADPLDLGTFEHKRFMFKFDYFKQIYNQIDADYYIYIDSDTFIVKPFTNLENILGKDPMHIFLENELTPRDFFRQWNGKKIQTLHSLFNSISGTEDKTFFNVNGGFFGMEKSKLPEILDKAAEFARTLDNRISEWGDEFILSLLAGYYINNIDDHLLKNNFQYYGIDTSGTFSNVIPQDNKWKYREWLSDVHHIINPAIIHCPSSKNLLYNFSVQVLSHRPEWWQEEIIPFNKENTHLVNIIIACSRQYNIPLLIRSIERYLIPEINCKIWISFNEEKSKIDKNILDFCESRPNISLFFEKFPNNIGGHISKNYMLSMIEDGWVYQLDDDNILYFNFFKKFLNFVSKNPNKKCFIFQQDKRYFPKDHSDVRCGIVDTAMYIFDRKFIGEERLPEVYGGDGMFIEKLFKMFPDECMVIPEVLCYYNKLEKLN